MNGSPTERIKMIASHGTSSPEAWLDAIVIERDGSMPQYQQLYRQLKEFVLQHKLLGGTVLPSTRSLSLDLRISRNTVVAAYEQLEIEGYIETRRGASARVVPLPLASEGSSEIVPTVLSNEFSRRGMALLGHEHCFYPPSNMLFQPGMPDMKSFPFGPWRRAINERVTLSADEVFGYHSFSGYPPLREAIASYLQTSRGVRCTADQIVVTNGAQGALSLLAQLFLDEGDIALLEEPGYTGARSAFLSAGAKLMPLRVDEGGWHLQDVEKARPQLIYVSPSCQFPLGATMRMEQRLRLIELAEKSNAWIVEDDCESEHRFSTKPVAALQGFCYANKTVYVGTFSKILFPSLRIGYIVFPTQVDRRISKAIFLSGISTPLFLQAALADFIEKGYFTKHLRRMRRLYSFRRSLFTDLVTDYLGTWLAPFPSDAGLHTLWKMRRAGSDLEVVERAKKLSMGIVPLSPHFLHTPPTNGLLMGYATADERTMHAGLRQLMNVFRETK